MIRFTASLLALICAVNTLRAEDKQSGDFKYTSDGSAITITGYTGKDVSITIPGTIDGLPVRMIGYASFNAGGNKSLKNLTSVTIPSGVTQIEPRAFQWCDGLVRVALPEGVTSIGSSAFSNCPRLSTITLPSSVTSIGGWAFGMCESLTSVTVPSGVTTIGGAAFIGCKTLSSIGVDEANRSYRSVDGVLFNADQTELIQYPAGKKERSYSIPGTVTKFGEGAFANALFISLTIPGSVASIGKNMFMGCKDLTDVTISPGITSIGEYAFIGCSGLSKLTIPSGVTSIGDSAFENCTSLANITLPDSITSIGSQAFNGCKSLTQFSIPPSVNSIKGGAFTNCAAMADISVAAGNPAFGSEKGILFDANKTLLVQYPAGKTAKSYAIPGGVIKIGYKSFSGCTGLANVVIPDSVTEIRAYAFKGCTGLTSVTIPEHVGMIEDEVFGACAGLTSAVFKGNAPSYFRADAFKGTAPGFTIYFRPGATGFTTPKWNGYPAREGEPSAEPQPAGPLSWTSNDGKVIKANFVKLDGEAVVVRMEDGKEHKISFTRLSPESVAQAKKLGGTR